MAGKKAVGWADYLAVKQVVWLVGKKVGYLAGKKVVW